MKILITGGTGFLGRHLVWRFAGEGAEVVFTGRCFDAADTVCKLSPRPVHWRPIEHGTREAPNQLQACAEGATAIVHCAALSSPWGRPADFRRANIDSTVEVLAACLTAGVERLVHISTPSIYFDFQDRLAIREDSPLPKPVNEYARSKAEAERIILQETPVATVILRPRALFGPWDETLMPRLLRVMRQGPIPLLRGGRAQVDLTYVDNVVDAVWLALNKSLPRRVATYNVSNGEPIELATLLDMVAKTFELPLRTRALPWSLIKGFAGLLETAAALTGAEPALTRYSAGVLAFSQTLDIGAISRDLGYFPKVSLEEGIRRHAQWWLARQAGSTP